MTKNSRPNPTNVKLDELLTSASGPRSFDSAGTLQKENEQLGNKINVLTNQINQLAKTTPLQGILRTGAGAGVPAGERDKQAENLRKWIAENPQRAQALQAELGAVQSSLHDLNAQLKVVNTAAKTVEQDVQAVSRQFRPGSTKGG